MEVTINYNGQAVAVEVTLEVYEFLDRAYVHAKSFRLCFSYSIKDNFVIGGMASLI